MMIIIIMDDRNIFACKNSEQNLSSDEKCDFIKMRTDVARIVVEGVGVEARSNERNI